MTKSTYSRAERVADQIRMEVADILMRKIKDPRVRSVTVTDVELTRDLRIARVFVTTMEQNKDERHVFDGQVAEQLAGGHHGPPERKILVAPQTLGVQ